MKGRIQARKPGDPLGKWAEFRIRRVAHAASRVRSEMQRLWKSCLDDSGASLVEFTVSAAVLFMALFGIIQCSLGLYAYNYVSDAAREGTRFAIVRGSNCTALTYCQATEANIQTYLRGFQYPGIDVNNLVVTANWFNASATTPTTWTSCGTGNGCKVPGNAVQVQVKYTFPLRIPYWKNASVSIASVSQMVISN
jgi:Flp pilus assembly protein TadG